jgi:secreted Zn-dependent insulinase-like peptidase
MKEMELRIFAGWEPGSDMPATYLHLSGEDVDKRILAMHGITPEEDKPTKDETLTPQKCPRCLHVNPADAKYCMQCSLVLDAKKAQDVEAFEDKSADLLRELLGSEDGQRLLSAIKKMEK